MDPGSLLGEDGSPMSAARGMASERCSTCGRPSPSVRKLFPARATGVDLVICDECVGDCARLIADGPTRIPGAAQMCRFCNKTEEQVSVIVGIGPALICDECVDAYRTELG